jgi:cytochrome b561
MRSTRQKWGFVIRLFHWGMFVALLLLVGVGVYMTGLPASIHKVHVYAMHKSFGVTLLAVAALRLAWRAYDARPLPATMPIWQSRLAALMTAFLYLLLVLIPLTGWLYNSAAGFPLRWFDLGNLPALMAADPTLKPILRVAHHWLAWLLVVCVVLHASAAIKHHVYDKDSTLKAMLPW